MLYYGLAGAKSPRPLRSRLNDLIKHSKGRITDRGPHKGGEIQFRPSGSRKQDGEWHPGCR